MRFCRVLFGSALVSSCLTFDAQAQVITEPSDTIAAGFSPTETTTGLDDNPLSDLIFNDGFDGQNLNGGISCATATILDGGLTYTANTTAAPNWMNPFGPLISASNDVVYVFVAGPVVDGSITPTSSNYAFAMYLIPSCQSGTEPVPLGASSTIGTGIDLVASGVVSGNTYYLAITGSAPAGASANGTLNFTTPFSIAIPPGF